MFRAKLVKREDDYLFMMDTHHIVSDGMSMGTFLKECSVLYNGGELEEIQTIPSKIRSERDLRCL